MALLGTRLYLAFDASAVAAAALSEGLGGRRARGFARVPLGPGALLPSAVGPNLLVGDEVRAAVRRAVSGLDGDRATVVLPDGVARVALVDLPEGADPREYVRYRLAASLPWPAAEAVVDALPAGRGRVVGAAVRRSTVAEYEQAVIATGLGVDRVHLAPLVALEGLMRSGTRDALHLVLGDVALCLATFRAGLLVGLRSRRRDPSGAEASWLREEAARAVALEGDGAGSLPLVLSGCDAPRLRREIGAEPAERGLRGPGEWPDAAEAAWLGGLVS